MNYENPSGRVCDDPPQEATSPLAGKTPLSSGTSTPGSSDIRRKSTNPFRKHEDLSGSESMIIRSPDSAQSIGKRKETPVRAVFNDLPTAYSSITSGNARIGLRAFSSQSTAADEEASIALQDLDPSKRPDEALFQENLPLVPYRALLPRSRSYKRGQNLTADQDNLAVARLATPLEPSLPERKPSMLSSLKNAITSITSPSPSHWPQDRQDGIFDHDARSLPMDEGPQDIYYVENDSIYHSSHYPSGTQGGNYGAGGIGSSSYRETGRRILLSYEPGTLPPSSPPPPVGTQFYKSSRLASSSTNISMPEGSTIGNIVQHYVGSEARDGEVIDVEERQGVSGRSRNHFGSQIRNQGRSPSSPINGPPGLKIPKQRKSDKRGGGPYPQNSQAENSDNVVPNSSSYEAQHGNQGAKCAQKAGGNTKDDNGLWADVSTSDAANSTLASLPHISHINPYRYNQARNSLLRADPGHCVYDDGHSYARKPLEREVSEALRRASGYSVYSVDSVSSSLMDFGAIINYGKTHASQSLVKHTGSQNSKTDDHAHTGDHYGGAHNVDKQGKDFYDESAIPSDWINSRQGIRIPITKNGANPVTPPNPSSADAQKASKRRSTPESDVNDWETVGESAFGGPLYDDGKDFGMLGGDFHRVGSSIANTSDAGTSSMQTEELEEFGSTDRITQHPGSIQYSGDYRQRDVKKLKTKVPVLMPVFHEHKVNGYLADSMRLRQPQNPIYFRSPSPLPESHKHPFNSSPPDVTQVPRPKGILRSLLTPNRSTQKEESSKLNKVGQGSHSEWTNSYRQTGPSVSTQIHPFPFQGRDRNQDRPNSYAYVVNQAHDDTMPDLSSSELHMTSANSRSLEDNMPFHDVPQDEKQGVEAPQAIGKKRPVIPTRIEPASARRPPGALYQGLRAVSGQHRNGSSQYDGTAKSAGKRIASKTHESKSLRPLSLVADRQPSTPISSNNHSPYVGPNEFVYRSPLAPLQHTTWENLYPVSRLFEFKERAKADGFNSSRTTFSADESERLARRHVYEPPRLATRKGRQGVNYYNNSSLLARKSKISWAALTVCAIFPPLLILYSLGMLDCFMAMYSGNEFYEFGKKQKKWAMIVMGVELTAIVILVAAAVGTFYANKHKS